MFWHQRSLGCFFSFAPSSLRRTFSSPTSSSHSYVTLKTRLLAVEIAFPLPELTDMCKEARSPRALSPSNAKGRVCKRSEVYRPFTDLLLLGANTENQSLQVTP